MDNNKLYFQNTDFNNMSLVKNINSTFDNKEGYTNTQKTHVDKLQKPIWDKMNEIKQTLENELYFGRRFDIKISRRYKETNQYAFGNIQHFVWISLVDKKTILNFPNGTKYGHLRLPQIQVAINTNRFTTASIWFEKNSEVRKYRETFAKYLSINYESLKKNFTFNVYDEKRKKDIKFTKEELISYLINNKYKIGIRNDIYENECIKFKDNITSRIISDLQFLIDKVYYPCFKFKLPDSTFDNEVNLDKKERGKWELLMALRGKLPSRKIILKHRVIQNKLFDYFKDKYKDKNIVKKIEEGFVDFKLIFPGQNKVYLYEIKTDKNSLQCIKHGLGQLLIYALKEDNDANLKLHIVGLNPINKKSLDFLNNINNYLGKYKIHYLYYNERTNELL